MWERDIGFSQPSSEGVLSMVQSGALFFELVRSHVYHIVLEVVDDRCESHSDGLLQDYQYVHLGGLRDDAVQGVHEIAAGGTGHQGEEMCVG
jgi:hypothetical protein